MACLLVDFSCFACSFRLEGKACGKLLMDYVVLAERGLGALSFAVWWNLHGFASRKLYLS